MKNREIEFRAWSTFGKKMHYLQEKQDLWSFLRSCYGMDLMQFTGLLDKNGNKIFEGDLLKDDRNFIYRVYAIKGGFAINVNVKIWQNEIKRDYPFPLQPLADEQTVSYIEHVCEIIGNIYENPELLDL